MCEVLFYVKYSIVLTKTMKNIRFMLFKKVLRPQVKQIIGKVPTVTENLFRQKTEWHLDDLINYFNWLISFSSNVIFGPEGINSVETLCMSLFFAVPVSCPRAMWQYVALFRTTAGYL